jgi:hypothetical protein
VASVLRAVLASCDTPRTGRLLRLPQRDGMTSQPDEVIDALLEQLYR